MPISDEEIANLKDEVIYARCNFKEVYSKTADLIVAVLAERGLEAKAVGFEACLNPCRRVEIHVKI